MKFEISEASDIDLQHFLQMFIIAKFAPDERHLLIGHHTVQPLLETAISQYIQHVGREQYEQNFYRSYLNQCAKDLLSGQLADIFPMKTTNKDEVLIKLKELALPIILSDELTDEIIEKARVMESCNFD